MASFSPGERKRDRAEPHTGGEGGCMPGYTWASITDMKGHGGPSHPLQEQAGGEKTGRKWKRAGCQEGQGLSWRK